MKYFLEDMEVLQRIATADKIELFLDYDGTITPIVETPEKARLLKSTKEILQQLSKLPKYQITIISGRAIDDIRSLVGIASINYVGNHGYEMMVPGVEIENLASPGYYDLLNSLKNEINNKLIDFPGAFIEDKGVTISIHYRQVNPDQAVILEHVLYRMTQPGFESNKIRFNMGKKVFEIRPPLDWDKGKAVEWILEKQNGFPIYIGDDTTDEDAFFALKDKGITVYVGSQYREFSCAQYFLNSTDEVIKFLAYLCEVKNDK